MNHIDRVYTESRQKATTTQWRDLRRRMEDSTWQALGDDDDCSWVSVQEGGVAVRVGLYRHRRTMLEDGMTHPPIHRPGSIQTRALI